MKDLARYLRNIADAVRSTVTGMKITLRYWVREPSITVEYPDRLGPGRTVEDITAPRFRGLLELRASRCIGCLQCMRACPIDCIAVRVERRGETRWIDRFDVDQAKCMHCGLCVEVCPTEALVFSRRFEGACYDIRELCIRHISEPVPAARPVKKTA